MTAARLVLFDIDNTLLWAGGAGSRAFDRAFAECFAVSLQGLADARGDVPMAGRTDTAILRDLLRRHGLSLDGDGQQARFVESYIGHLRATLAEGRGRVLPGVVDLLGALQGRTSLGLATGNWREPAWLKLRHFGLDGHFAEGGFGEAGEERAAVVGEALTRFEQRLLGPIDPRAVVVVGDTPEDLLAAKAHGCRSIAVATGSYSAEELARHRPDHLFADLADTNAVLEHLLG